MSFFLTTLILAKDIINHKSNYKLFNIQQIKKFAIISIVISLKRNGKSGLELRDIQIAAKIDIQIRYILCDTYSCLHK